MWHNKSFRLATLVAALAIASGCGALKSAQETTSRVIVEVAPAIQRETRLYREWNGTIDGYISAEIRPHVQGRIVRRHYQEGSLVTKGDILFEIDPRPLAPAPEDVAPGQAELAQALGDSRTKVVSPLDGFASGSRRRVGDLVGSNDVLTTVSTVDWIKVHFYATRQEYASWTARRASSESQTWGESRDRGVFELLLEDGVSYPHPGRLWPGGRRPDRAGELVALTVVFPNPQHLLRPGQSARLRAAVDVSDSAILVPLRAVFERQGHPHVAVVGPDNMVVLRAVQVGELVGPLQLIEEGLEPGDRIIARGVEAAKPGMFVRTKPVETTLRQGSAGNTNGAMAL